MTSRALGLALTLALTSAVAAEARSGCFERQSNTCGGWRTIQFFHIVAADPDRRRLEAGERFELSPPKALEIAAAELRRARHLGERFLIAGVSPTEESCAGRFARFYLVEFYSESRCPPTKQPYATEGMPYGYLIVLMNGKVLLPRLRGYGGALRPDEWAARRIGTRESLERMEEMIDRNLRSLARQGRGLVSGLKCSLLACPDEEGRWWFPSKTEWPQLLPQQARALAARRLRGIMNTTKDGVRVEVQLRRGVPGGWYYLVRFDDASKPGLNAWEPCHDFADVDVWMTGKSAVSYLDLGCPSDPLTDAATGALNP
jgi:hypothetical protein